MTQYNIEKTIEKSGMSWTFLRCNQFMQNFSNHTAYSINHTSTIYAASGDAKISHVDVRDVAEVAIKCLTEDGHNERSYVLIGPSAINYYDAAEELSSTIGRKVTYVNIDLSDFQQGMIAQGVPYLNAERFTDIERYCKEGEPSEISTDISKILGRDATTFSDFVKDYSATGIWSFDRAQ